MKDKKQLVAEARQLYGVMETVWDNYDFSEMSNLYEHRVPEMKFNADIQVMVNEVHYIPGRPSMYVREYQVSYNNQEYIFQLAAHIEEDFVRKFVVTVAVPAGDGRGGVHRLFSENLV